MAEISKLKIGSTSYDIKDATARAAMAGGMHFKGLTTTDLTDGSHTSPIKINNDDYTPVAGDIVLNGVKEFVWDGVAGSGASSYSGTWYEFGNQSGLGRLAYKNSASGDINTNAHSHSYDKTSVTHSVTNPSMTSTGSFTPTGSISVGGSSGTSYTPTGSIGTGATSGAEVVTGGSNSSSTVTLSGGSTSKLVLQSIPVNPNYLTTHDTPTLNTSSIGSASDWSAGSLPSYTYDSSSETLTLATGSLPSLTVTPTTVGTSLAAGKAQQVVSIEGGTTTVVATGEVSPDGGGATVATALHTGGTAAAQAFNPTTTKLGFTGTATKLAFSGSSGTVSVTGTPNVSVADHTQTSTATNSVTVTGTATVS